MIRIFQIAQITLMTFCLIANSSCTAARSNNERFWYRKSLNALSSSLTQKTKSVCNISGSSLSSLRDPKFIHDPTISFADGFTFYNEITYRNFDVIPHESLHYVSLRLQLTPECVEEMLGDVLNVLVHERAKK